MAKTCCLVCDRTYPEVESECPGCGHTTDEQIRRSRIEIDKLRSSHAMLQGFRAGLSAGFEIYSDIVHRFQ